MLKSQRQEQKKQTLKTKPKPSTRFIMITCQESSRDTMKLKKLKNLLNFWNSKKQLYCQNFKELFKTKKNWWKSCIILIFKVHLENKLLQIEHRRPLAKSLLLLLKETDYLNFKIYAIYMHVRINIIILCLYINHCINYIISK